MHNVASYLRKCRVSKGIMAYNRKQAFHQAWNSLDSHEEMSMILSVLFFKSGGELFLHLGRHGQSRTNVEGVEARFQARARGRSCESPKPFKGIQCSRLCYFFRPQGSHTRDMRGGHAGSAHRREATSAFSRDDGHPRSGKIRSCVRKCSNGEPGGG